MFRSMRPYRPAPVASGDFEEPRLSSPGPNTDGTPSPSVPFDGRSQVEVASLKVSAPFRIGRQQLAYQFGWSMQNALTPITSPDYFSIGSRYSVRRFDQQSTLAAESGWAVSNALDWYVPTSRGTQAMYAGIDAGRVRGKAAQYLKGNTARRSGAGRERWPGHEAAVFRGRQLRRVRRHATLPAKRLCESLGHRARSGRHSILNGIRCACL